MPPFKVEADFEPAGDQPRAVAGLAERVQRGDRFATLLGATGTGKTATLAWALERIQKPTLVIAPNKSLAAQLANEFKQFFPNNAVEYFVSYYDYYQPEAYVPSSDTYIEKDSSINDEIERLRHAATSRRPSSSWSVGWTAASGSRPCSASPAAAKRAPSPRWSRGGTGRR